MGAEPPNDLDVSVVVPAYNEEAFLPRSLASIQTALRTAQPWRSELIVVDNNSTDRTADIARQAGAMVVFEPVNQIARARNRGAAAARGRCLIFVDADTTIPPDLVRDAVAVLTEEPVCGGGAHMGSSEAGRLGLALAFGTWNLVARHVGWAAGALVYCRRDGWEETGGFDETVYASEEIHFSRALRRWGKARGLRFRMLPHRVDTSMRKFRWYSGWQLLWAGLRFAARPSRLRDRHQCAVWYDRPDRRHQNHEDD